MPFGRNYPLLQLFVLGSSFTAMLSLSRFYHGKINYISGKTVLSPFYSTHFPQIYVFPLLPSVHMSNFVDQFPLQKYGNLTWKPHFRIWKHYMETPLPYMTTSVIVNYNYFQIVTQELAQTLSKRLFLISLYYVF